MQPQPESDVQALSGDAVHGHGRRGPRSGGRTSRIGGKCERYVSQMRDVKSPRNTLSDEWCSPSSQMGSLDLSTPPASVSSRYRIALSLPCLAAASSPDVRLGDDAGDGVVARGNDDDDASSDGSDRSVVLLLNVCENQPDSRVGRSASRADDGAGVEAYSEMRGGDVDGDRRGRGTATATGSGDSGGRRGRKRGRRVTDSSSGLGVVIAVDKQTSVFISVLFTLCIHTHHQ